MDGKDKAIAALHESADYLRHCAEAAEHLPEDLPGVLTEGRDGLALLVIGMEQFAEARKILGNKVIATAWERSDKPGDLYGYGYFFSPEPFTDAERRFEGKYVSLRSGHLLGRPDAIGLAIIVEPGDRCEYVKVGTKTMDVYEWQCRENEDEDEDE